MALERPVPVGSLPGFKEGWVSVQDAGAQLAPLLLEAQPGMRVLDACAAPGSKTSHLLEAAAGPLEVTAVDIDAGRLGRIAENLERLGLTARLVAADVRDPGAFWDGRPYDRILVDAPCSGTGVIRRHPDIKLLRRAGDVAAFARTQLEILRAAFGMLAPGGRLVYATCSVLPAENEAVVARFLDEEPQASPAPMPHGEGLAPGGIAGGGRHPASLRRSGGKRRVLLCLSRKDNARNRSIVFRSERLNYLPLHSCHDGSHHRAAPARTHARLSGRA